MRITLTKEQKESRILYARKYYRNLTEEQKEARRVRSRMLYYRKNLSDKSIEEKRERQRAAFFDWFKGPTTKNF